MLPAALLDLAIARSSSSRQPSARSFQVFRRAFATHAAAIQPTGTIPPAYNLAQRPNVPPIPNNAFALQPHRPEPTPEGLKEFETRLDLLEQDVKSQYDNSPSFTEEQLLSLYSELINFEIPHSTPSPAAQIPPPPLDSDTLITRMLDRVSRLPISSPDSQPKWVTEFMASTSPRRRLLAHLGSIFHRSSDGSLSLDLGAVIPDRSQKTMASIISHPEVETLFQTLVSDQDTQGLEVLLRMAPEAKFVVSEDNLSAVMAIYAEAGDPTGLESFMTKFIAPEATSPPQRHYHIKSYIRALPHGVYPTTALSVLHSYEKINKPAPMKSYNSLISALFRVQQEQATARSQAWDLFAHMRYVAHPNPDVQMYATMIRACASPISSARYQAEPERALDLWTEMTVDKSIAPTSGAYDAIILACTRSGQKLFVDHGFKFVREMVDGYRDAAGRSAFYPTRRTFHAMLEGLKRTGDLGRVRWIVAEMARLVSLYEPDLLREKGERDIDEETMVHVFHAYASFRPPSSPHLVKKLRDPAQDTPTKEAKSSPNAEPDMGPSASQNVETDPENSAWKDFGPRLFSNAPHIPPQDSHEVIAESRLLFERIVSSRDAYNALRTQETNETNEANQPSKFDLIFRHVHLTPKLVNSLLHVHYFHSTDITNIRDIFGKLYSPASNLGLTPDASVFVDALERCALQSQRSRYLPREERDAGIATALEWSEQLWSIFQKDHEPLLSRGLFEPAGRIQTKDARLIERAWIAWIKTLTLSYRLTRAMAQVRAFATRYPPSLVRGTSFPAHIMKPQNSPVLYKTAELSTQTRLSTDTPRPLIRYTPHHGTPDSFVPPVLTFKDIMDLHRMISTSQHQRSQTMIQEELGFLKWICKRYDVEVRLRRRKVLEAEASSKSTTPSIRLFSHA